MSFAYLDPQTARQDLIRYRAYTEETAPSEEELAWILMQLEPMIEEWLGQRLTLTAYRERTTSNDRGIVLLSRTPVRYLLGVYLAPLQHAGFPSVPLQPLVIYNELTNENRVATPYPNRLIQVEYVAGYETLPAIVPMTIAQVLRAILKQSGTSGDLSFLQDPYLETTSISLPGGLSKSFKGGLSGRTNDQAAPTLLSRLLLGLETYRRRWRLGGITDVHLLGDGTPPPPPPPNPNNQVGPLLP